MGELMADGSVLLTQEEALVLRNSMSKYVMISTLMFGVSSEGLDYLRKLIDDMGGPA